MKGYDFRNLFVQFQTEGDYICAEPYGAGHINNTYLIRTTKKSYILQRVNDDVFKNPVAVIENVANITAFLAEKIKKENGDPEREALNLVPAVDGKMYHITEKGDLFRMYLYIDRTICYQSVENAEVFYKVAKIFGKFQNMLADFPAEKLHETIKRFHDTPNRYTMFHQVLDADPMGRRSEVEKEIAFVLDREKDAGIIVDALNAGEIPLRVTHNDTKLNNVLIDEETRDGLCVVDLDTVMPGSLLYDYGDSIRFGASTADEDEKDLSSVWMDLDLFEAYTKGYLEELGDSITPKEVEFLPLGAKIITLECGLRFLTDYLDGDRYFRIHRPNQNLDRARTQFKLVQDMEEKEEKMKAIVAKYYSK